MEYTVAAGTRRGVFQRMIGNRKVEHIDLKFNCLADKEQLDTFSKSASQMAAKSRVRWGLRCPYGAVWLKLKPPSVCCRSFALSLLAICKAEHSPLVRSVGIYSGSFLAHQMVTNPSALTPLTVEVRSHRQKALFQSKSVNSTRSPMRVWRVTNVQTIWPGKLRFN